jgi:hypothetical protein
MQEVASLYSWTDLKLVRNTWFLKFFYCCLDMFYFCSVHVGAVALYVIMEGEKYIIGKI